MGKITTKAAIHFAADAFVMDRPSVMGRHVAGHTFLRAVVEGRDGERVVGYGSHQAMRPFSKLVSEIDPTAKTVWIRNDEIGRLSQAGVCHRPDPMLGAEARLRLRSNPARYCLTGVHHTISTSHVSQALADLLRDPLMPWDALICTSEAAMAAVREVLEAEAEYLRWRFGDTAKVSGPQLVNIPLGVHTQDFSSSPSKGAAGGPEGIDGTEIVALFVGRLALSAKAHPLAMFEAMQQAAQNTPQRLCLMLYGQFPNAEVERVFREAAAHFAPDVRLHVGNGDPGRRAQAFASADFFISLSDNVQETFGITPLEAMAAGLPVVATDWNGYRATVRHGVDGFLIPTWSPAAGVLDHAATAYEADVIDHDAYVWAGAVATSLDHRALAQAVTSLTNDADLRRRMGDAGRQRARSEFDWSVIYRRYQELWGALTAHRISVAEGADQMSGMDAAPPVSSSGLEMFAKFRSYPTRAVTAATQVGIDDRADTRRAIALHAHELFIDSDVRLEDYQAALALLGEGRSVAELAAGAKTSVRRMILNVSVWAKMGLVRLAD